jgi:hypothetical protein
MENCKLLEHLKYLEAELKTQRAHQNELLNELGKVRYDLNQCQRVNNTFGREVLLYRELNLRLHSELEDTRKELASANALHLASATEALPPPLPQDSLFGGALHFAHTSMTVHNGGLILSPFQSPHPSPKKLTPARSGGGI